MKKTLVIVAALMMAAPAMAGINVTWTVDQSNVGVDVYTLYADSDDPTYITASMDLTITGNLVQHKAMAFDTPDMTYQAFLTPEQQATDTHFLVAAGDVAVGRTLTETATTLDGAFGIYAGDQVDPFAFAQVGVPTGEAFDIVGALALNDSNGTQSPVQMTVPEPATMSLLGVGALALVRRRSR